MTAEAVHVLSGPQAGAGAHPVLFHIGGARVLRVGAGVEATALQALCDGGPLVRRGGYLPPAQTGRSGHSKRLSLAVIPVRLIVVGVQACMASGRNVALSPTLSCTGCRTSQVQHFVEKSSKQAASRSI